MEDLQAIWNKLHELQQEVGAMIDEPAIDDTLQQLRTREDARLREAKLLRVIIFGTIFFLVAMVLLVAYLTHQPVAWTQFLGIALVGLGMYWMHAQFLRTQITIEPRSYDQDAQGFISAARNQLLLRKQLLIFAPIIYAFLLLGGMHLLIHPYISALDAYWGIIAGSYGLTLGILGAGIGMQLQKFQREFGPILNRFERFLAE
jgi:O-antigen/teichoic acid export membrane protein